MASRHCTAFYHSNFEGLDSTWMQRPLIQPYTSPFSQSHLLLEDSKAIQSIITATIGRLLPSKSQATHEQSDHTCLPAVRTLYNQTIFHPHRTASWGMVITYGGRGPATLRSKQIFGPIQSQGVSTYPYFCFPPLFRRRRLNIMIAVQGVALIVS